MTSQHLKDSKLNILPSDFDFFNIEVLLWWRRGNSIFIIGCLKILSIHFLTNFKKGKKSSKTFCCWSRICNTSRDCCSVCELRLLSVKWLSSPRFSKFLLCLCQIHNSLTFVISIERKKKKEKACARLKIFKSISIEHLRAEEGRGSFTASPGAAFPKAGNKRPGDGRCEDKTPLYESVCPSLSHLEKNAVLAQFTLLVGKIVVIKLAFFTDFCQHILQPCLKSTVRYTAVSWEIRQMHAMFKNDLSVKWDNNWLNCWLIKEFLLFLLDKQTFYCKQFSSF